MLVQRFACKPHTAQKVWIWYVFALLVLPAFFGPIDTSAGEPKVAEVGFWRTAKWLRSLDLFSDALERVRADYVHKPDTRRLIRGAIDAIIKAGPDIEHDPATTMARKALEGLPTGGDESYAALIVFGDFLEAIHGKVAGRLLGEQMIEAAIQGMVGSLDPNSEYINVQRYKAMQGKAGSERGGVGVNLTIENASVIVVAPIEDSPAAKGGLLPRDRITHIDDVSVNGLTLEQVIDELTGPINAPVSLTIERKTREKAFRITLVRQVIYVRSVSSRAVNDIGYINIKTFNEQTHTALVEAVLSLKKDIGRRLRGYIVDLRDNSGGLLDQVIAVADDFLDQGAILISGGRTASDQQRANARPGDIAEGLPIVVLINGNTAAGAEILAATLKGNGRATIVGARTVGNGTVQTIVPLASHGALRLTTSRVVAPSLSNGVIPNLAIAAGSGRGDVQLDAALQYVRAGKRQ